MEEINKSISPKLLFGSASVQHKTVMTAIVLIIVNIVVGAIFFYLIEGHSFLDALYFVVVTMATIGYGDIVPLTTVGKILTMVYAVAGVPMFIYTTTLIFEKRLRNIMMSYIKTSTDHTVDHMHTKVEEVKAEIQELHEKMDASTKAHGLFYKLFHKGEHSSPKK